VVDALKAMSVESLVATKKKNEPLVTALAQSNLSNFFRS
jgi:hypothetical protein